MEKFWNVRLGSELAIDLPLVHVNGDFYIYAFDMMGQRIWNQVSARSLVARLKEASADFDILLTAEAKAIGLTEEMAGLIGHDEYVVLRKSLKAYMRNPAVVDVKSITTESLQHFYLSEQRFPALVGKRVCVVDDVVSTGGTLEAFFRLAGQVGFQIAYIACALTEGERRDSFNGAPLFSLDHIPLPR
ncbi:MAG: adenine phosphoribosyltransferase [Clostridiales bacterium]|jgi:adenine phosphoribosyltransferase|nr:adenine phosphoribosyltransferase [Clostridiales bacterium]